MPPPRLLPVVGEIAGRAGAGGLSLARLPGPLPPKAVPLPTNAPRPPRPRSALTADPPLLTAPARLAAAVARCTAGSLALIGLASAGRSGSARSATTRSPLAGAFPKGATSPRSPGLPKGAGAVSGASPERRLAKAISAASDGGGGSSSSMAGFNTPTLGRSGAGESIRFPRGTTSAGTSGCGTSSAIGASSTRSSGLKYAVSGSGSAAEGSVAGVIWTSGPAGSAGLVGSAGPAGTSCTTCASGVVTAAGSTAVANGAASGSAAGPSASGIAGLFAASPRGNSRAMIAIGS